jgi:hypothetical protein
VRRREQYLLLFGAPALLASLLLGAIVLVFALAIFWVFIFGDDTWPGYTNTLLAVLFVATAGGTWITLLFFAYAEGRRQEDKPSLDRRHLAWSVAATLALLVVPGLYVWHSGMAVDPTPEGACARFCVARGFDASGMPPRDSGLDTCTCYGTKGEAAASFSLREALDRSK